MRVALKTLLSVTALAVPNVAIGVLSPGPYAPRVLQGGLIMFALGGAGSAYVALRGSTAEREWDEREEVVLGRSMKFTFMVTALAIQAYWSYHFALAGNAGDTAFYLLAVFWSAFAAAYAYNRLRA